MKKLIAIFVLVLLATSAFAAVSITDWYTIAYYDLTHHDYGDIVTDMAPAGFVFANNPDEWYYDGTEYREPAPDFYSGNVSGWVYDEGDSFTVSVSGFGDLLTYKEYEGATPKINVHLRTANGEWVRFRTYWNGDGTYVFDDSNLRQRYGRGEVTRVSIDFRLGSALYHVTENTTGSVQFLVPDEEQPQTEVLEPATVAYGLMGLGSLAGIKRRIKK